MRYRCYYEVKTTYFVEIEADSIEEAKLKYDNWQVESEPEELPELEIPDETVKFELVRD